MGRGAMGLIGPALGPSENRPGQAKENEKNEKKINPKICKKAHGNSENCEENFLKIKNLRFSP